MRVPLIEEPGSGEPTMTWPARDGFETRTVTATDGTRLRIAMKGPADAPRVLFVHGFPQNAAIWRRTVACLGGKVRALLLDLRGYGGSELAKTGRYDLDTLANDFVRVLEETADEGRKGPAILVAHDWGGVIAWELVLRRPDLVKHFIAVNAPLGAAYVRELRTNRAQRRASWYVGFFQLPFVEHLLASNGASFVERALRGSAREGTFTDEDVELLAGPMRDVRRVRAALAYYRASRQALITNPATANDTRQVEVPATILWGRRDTALMASLAENIVKDHAPHAKLEWLDDASHWVPDEAPDAIARAVLDAAKG